QSGRPYFRQISRGSCERIVCRNFVIAIRICGKIIATVHIEPQHFPTPGIVFLSLMEGVAFGCLRIARALIAIADPEIKIPIDGTETQFSTSMSGSVTDERRYANGDCFNMWCRR